MKSRFSLLYLLMVLPLAACDDGFGPQEWSATPDTIVLYSLSRPEHFNRASGFDFGAQVGIPRRVESTFTPGQWDVVLIETNGGFAFAPASSFEGQSSRAGLATVTGTTLEELERAPGDSQFLTTPVALNTGTVYAVRSRLIQTIVSSCSYYSKFEVLELNQAEGWVRFRYILNPYCGDRRLIPPDSD